MIEVCNLTMCLCLPDETGNVAPVFVWQWKMEIMHTSFFLLLHLDTMAWLPTEKRREFWKSLHTNTIASSSPPRLSCQNLLLRYLGWQETDKEAGSWMDRWMNELMRVIEIKTSMWACYVSMGLMESWRRFVCIPVGTLLVFITVVFARLCASAISLKIWSCSCALVHFSVFFF